MEDFATQPHARVFRIDTECYILYLGKDGSEYRPFLRIGNTPEFPEELKELVYSIVVTDGITGSPIVEPANLDLAHTSDFRYIGDPKTVDRFKRFLKHLEIPSKGYQQYTGDVLEDSGCFVYFYENQNIKVTFDRSELFDLKTREDHDKHYPQRADAIKAQFVRNTLRFDASQSESPALLLRNGSLYLSGGGDVAAFDLSTEYFRELAERGHDPDQLSVVVADEPSEGLVRLFKRAVRKGTRVRVLTGSPADLRNLVDLFSDGNESAPVGEVVDRAEKGSVELGALSVRVPKILKSGGAGLQFSCHGVEGRVKARPDKRSSGRGAQLILTLSNEALQLPGGRSLVMLDGVPYRLHAGAPEFSEMLREYWPLRSNGLGVALGEGALARIAALEELRSAFGAGAGVKGSKGAVNEALKAWRAAAGEELSEFEGQRVALAVHNVRALAEHGYEHASPQDRKTYAQVLEQLEESAELNPEVDERPDAYLPGVIGDIYLGGASPLLLYRPPSPATKTGFQRAHEIERRVHEQRDADTGAFVGERSRLRRLVGELDKEQAVTLPTEVQERLARQGDSESTESGRPLTARERLQQRAAAEREKRRETERRSPKERGGAAASSGSDQTRAAADARAKDKDQESKGAAKAGGAGSGSGTSIPQQPPRVQLRRATGGGFPWRSVGVAAAIILMLFAALLFSGVLSAPLERLSEGFGTAEEPAPDDPPEDPTEDPAPTPPAREPDDPELAEEPADDDPVQPDPDEPVDEPEPDVVPEPAEPDVADEPDVAPEPAEPEPDVAPEPVDEPEPAELPPEPDEVDPAAPGVELDPEQVDQRREMLEQLGLDQETRDLVVGADGIAITVRDVWGLVNVIAVDNGYRRLQDPKGAEGAELGPDPDWIFPGNRFTLPDDNEVTVVRGDTLWGIGAGFIRERLNHEAQLYFDTLARYRDGEVSAEETENVLAELEDETFSENFREAVSRTRAAL